MRKLSLTLFIMLLCIQVSADNVSQESAYQKARQFLKGKRLLPIPSSAKTRTDDLPSGDDKGYYVFNTEGDEGFVVVASDDRMPAILGYSVQGSLNPETAPSNVRWLLNYYDKIARLYATHPEQARVIALTRSSSRPAIRPLITTKWGQTAPYNLQCPTLNGQNCVTGCVATAMAQVINYHRWPQGMTSRVSEYVTGTSSIIVPSLESTSFDWDNMADEDMARLMRYCGQSVQMDYGTSESGAMPVNEAVALIRVFGYSQTAHYVENTSYSADDWEELLYNELAEQRPIVYNGWGTGGGHTFVVHGYQDGRFYINWGWNGNEDGYFVLTGLNTGIGNFNDTQSATIGIQPPAGFDASRPVVVAKGMWTGGRHVLRDEASLFKLQVSGELASDLTEQKMIDIGLALYDANGLKTVLWEETHDFKTDETYQFDAAVTIDGSVADGQYRIVPVSRNEKSGSWMADANASDYYLNVSLSGQYMKVVACPMSQEERSTEEVAIHAADGVAYALYTQYGRRRAEVLPITGGYKGDVYIADAVTFEGASYLVYKADATAFKGCTGLTSLSAAMTVWPSVSECPELVKIEMREGVASMDNPIQNCQKLTELTFPRSLSRIRGGAEWCEGLKTMKFSNPDLLVLDFVPHWDSSSLPALTDIYVMAAEVPVIEWMDLELKAHTTATLHVLKGMKAAYETSEWKGWKIADDLTAAASTGIEWGYCEGNKVTNMNVGDDTGTNDAEYAIHVPASMLEIYKGKKISKIQYYQAFTDYEYVFVTKPGTDYLVKQPVAKDAPMSWVSIDLEEPYTITGDELYVGVGKRYGIQTVFSDITTEAPDGFWFRMMGDDDSFIHSPGEWVNVADDTKNYCHPIPVRFVITGEDIPADLAIKDISVNPVSGSSYQIQAKVQSRTPQTVGKYTLKWNFDGKDEGSKVIETSLGTNRLETVTIDVPVAFNDRNHNLNYSITDIDGTADALSLNSTGTLNFNTPAITHYQRRIVMEEATGTWCGSCVHGTATIDKLTKEYPDNFIAISLHSNDQMSDIENYSKVTNRFTAYPGCIINRMERINPLYPNVLPLVTEMKDKAEAMVTATAYFAKPDRSAVTVKAESIFGFNDDKTANFGLAYVVTEDHVGPYEQTNSYSGSTYEGDMEFINEWGKLPPKVLVEHNHVGRGIYGHALGLDGSVPKAVKEGEAYQHAYSFKLPKTVQNTDNVSIVVLLIDKNTGEIMNACQTKIDYDPTVEEQVFEFRNGSDGLLSDATAIFTTAASEEAANCGTNIKPDSEGLTLATFDGKAAEGKAKLEIISSTLNGEQLSWTMGGETEQITGKTVAEKTFKTDAEGNVAIGLLASGVKDYGELKARLTATIGDYTQSVYITIEKQRRVVDNVTLKDGQVWWSNHDDGDARGGLMGSGTAERYHVATYIPQGLVGDKGTTIDGFAFNHSVESQANVSVWVATRLPDSDEEADLEVIRIPNEQLMLTPYSNVYSLVAFEHQYDIPEEGLYVGYSFDITNTGVNRGDRPLNFTVSEKNRKGAFWIKSEIRNPKWKDQSSAFGNVEMKVLFGGNLYRDAARTVDFPTAYGAIGGKAKVKSIIYNEGADAINSVTLQVRGQRGEAYESDLSVTVAPYSKADFNYELNADSEKGIDEKTVTITKVNGHPNKAREASPAKGMLYTLATKPKMVPVLENVTRVEDGSCLWNEVTAKVFSEKYGNDVIVINVHENDQMFIQEYFDIIKKSAYLGSFINRGEWHETYYGGTDRNHSYRFQPLGIEKYVVEAMDETPPASIGAKAVWADADKTSIDIHTETTFALDISDHHFQIGYVLLEDGLTGSGEAWKMANWCSGDTYLLNDPYLKDYVNMPETLTDASYTCVPVAAWNPYKGISATIPTSVSEGTTYPHVYTADIMGNLHIQNKDHLRVVALLLDKQFGTIINAAQCKIMPFGTDLSGITTNRATMADGRYYDLQGRRIEGAPGKGIYIRNGQKVVVK